MSFELNFEVSVGEFTLKCSIDTDVESLCLIGPNGAGKSTLLRALVGGLEPTHGIIRVGGDVFFDAAKAVRVPVEGRNVGYVPQSGALFPHLTVLENVSFALLAERDQWTGIERERLVQEALVRFGVEHLGERRPMELSGGECRRVALARALVRRPGLLVLDEPFAGVDVTRRPRLRESLVTAVNDIGARLIVATHDAADAVALSERVAVCEKGLVTGVSKYSDLATEGESGFVRSFLR